MVVYNKSSPAFNFAQTAAQTALRVARDLGTLEDIETVVMADATNVRKELTSMTNRELKLGVFQIQGMPGTQVFQIKDADTSVSVLRLNSDASKQATYFRSGAKGNVVGTFKERGRIRTQQFSWRSCAEDTVNIYRRVLNS
jgi:hypothetical protein